jgi:hypothetical protein
MEVGRRAGARGRVGRAAILRVIARLGGRVVRRRVGKLLLLLSGARQCRTTIAVHAASGVVPSRKIRIRLDALVPLIERCVMAV